jgi:hypothetical protein
VFFPKAEELEKKAKEADKAGEKEKASEYYLSVCAHESTAISDMFQPRIHCISNGSFPSSPNPKAKGSLDEVQDRRDACTRVRV